MKKTLIALAAVAAATAASAQVTLGGTYSVRVSNTDGDASPALSLGDNNLNVTATEDLGGGLSAKLFVESKFGGRLTSSSAHPATGRDVKLTVAGGFGSLTVGDYEVGQTHHMAYVGPVVGSDNNIVVSEASNVAGFGYTAPKMGDFTFSMSGTAGNALVDSLTYTFAVAYAKGPLAAKIDYNEDSERVRGGVTYDLGMAQVGLGFMNGAKKGTFKADQVIVGLGFPVTSALTLGAAYSKNQDTKAASVELGAEYALSKKTKAFVGMIDTNDEAVANGAKDYWRAQIKHSF